MQTSHRHLWRLIFMAMLSAMPAAIFASQITSPNSLGLNRQTITFSAFAGAGQMVGVNGPVQIGAEVQYNVVLTDPTGGGNIFLYNGPWSFLGNGDWNSGRNGYLGISPGPGPLRIAFASGAVYGFGAFVNYVPNDPRYVPPLIISAFDVSGALIESFAVSIDAPISTPNSLNAGAFRGILLDSRSIAYVEFQGSAAALDDFAFVTSSPVPDFPRPFSMALGVTAVISLVQRQRQRQRQRQQRRMRRETFVSARSSQVTCNALCVQRRPSPSLLQAIDLATTALGLPRPAGLERQQLAEAV